MPMHSSARLRLNENSKSLDRIKRRSFTGVPLPVDEGLGGTLQKCHISKGAIKFCYNAKFSIERSAVFG